MNGSIMLTACSRGYGRYEVTIFRDLTNSGRPTDSAFVDRIEEPLHVHLLRLTHCDLALQLAHLQ